MRKFSLSLLVCLLLLTGKNVHAQNGGYWFNPSSATYTDLSGATMVSTTTPWDSTANFTIPIGFNFVVDGVTVTNVYLHRVNSFCVDTITTSILHGFQLLNAALTDRGSGSSASPISYQLSGTAGSQVFKLEIKNAGFVEELINHSTLNDYVNIQLWLYEGTNVAEIHFGTSHVTNASEYFGYSFGNPIAGFAKRKSMTGNGVLYSVNGIASSPSNLLLDDSVVFTSHAITYLPQGMLGGLPPSGTVLKFTPEKANVQQLNAMTAHIYPTACKSNIIVDYTSSEKTTFEVISMKGIPTTMKGTLQNGSTNIDLSRIAAGNYLLKLQNSTGQYTQKFTKL